MANETLFNEAEVTGRKVLDSKPTQALVARTPLDLLQIALSNNAGIDVIERLSALQERAQDRDAEMQFNEAMNAAQAEIGRVAPNADNPQTHSRYATYSQLDRILRPIYVKHGFSLSFNSAESPNPEILPVLCYVSHQAGHTRMYRIDMPADGKGAKGGDVMTKTHATGSAMQYGMRYLLKAVFNIAVGVDDDGNLAGGKVNPNWLSEQRKEIKRCETLEGVKAAFKAAAAVALDEARDLSAYQALKEAAQTRGKELEKC